jgi:hypothetical protein
VPSKQYFPSALTVTRLSEHIGIARKILVFPTNHLHLQQDKQAAEARERKHQLLEQERILNQQIAKQIKRELDTRRLEDMRVKINKKGRKENKPD